MSWTFVPEVSYKHLVTLINVYFSAATDDHFALDYEEGSSPSGNLYGHYHNLYVWPKPGHIGALTRLTLTVLADTPVADSERALQIPGPPLR